MTLEDAPVSLYTIRATGAILVLLDNYSTSGQTVGENTVTIPQSGEKPGGPATAAGLRHLVRLACGGSGRVTGREAVAWRVPSLRESTWAVKIPTLWAMAGSACDSRNSFAPQGFVTKIAQMADSEGARAAIVLNRTRYTGRSSSIEKHRSMSRTNERRASPVPAALPILKKFFFRANRVPSYAG